MKPQPQKPLSLTLPKRLVLSSLSPTISPNTIHRTIHQEQTSSSTLSLRPKHSAAIFFLFLVLGIVSHGCPHS